MISPRWSRWVVVTRNPVPRPPLRSTMSTVYLPSSHSLKGIVIHHSLSIPSFGDTGTSPPFHPALGDGIPPAASREAQITSPELLDLLKEFHSSTAGVTSPPQTTPSTSREALEAVYRWRVRLSHLVPGANCGVIAYEHREARERPLLRHPVSGRLYGEVWTPEHGPELEVEDRLLDLTVAYKLYWLNHQYYGRLIHHSSLKEMLIMCIKNNGWTTGRTRASLQRARSGTRCATTLCVSNSRGQSRCGALS